MNDDLISRAAAIEAVEILLEQTEEDADVKTWNNAIMGAINSIKHHVPSAQQVRTQMSSADCISRQDAIEAVYKNDRYTTIKQRLDALPPAQPEIIRCKDCKHRYVEDMIWRCPFGLMGGENFFCGYGSL